MSQRKRPASRSGARPARPAARPGPGGGRRSGGAARGAEPKPFLTPGASAFRHSVERRSAVALVFLSRLPRALPGLLVAGLVVLALLAPAAWSAAALFAVAALLVWLVYLSWPSVPTPGRLVRVVVIAVVVAYAVARATT